MVKYKKLQQKGSAYDPVGLIILICWPVEFA